MMDTEPFCLITSGVSQLIGFVCNGVRVSEDHLGGQGKWEKTGQVVVCGG